MYRKHAPENQTVVRKQTQLKSFNHLLQKSDNLQYNTLVRWFAGTNESSTKRLMFQVLSLQQILQDIMKKKYLEHQTLGQ